MTPGSKMMMGKATVVDGAGNVANIVAPNYFTGAWGCGGGACARLGGDRAAGVLQKLWLGASG
jgi:hypothetical protein